MLIELGRQDQVKWEKSSLYSLDNLVFKNNFLRHFTMILTIEFVKK